MRMALRGSRPSTPAMGQALAQLPQVRHTSANSGVGQAVVLAEAAEPLGGQHDALARSGVGRQLALPYPVADGVAVDAELLGQGGDADSYHGTLSI